MRAHIVHAHPEPRSFVAAMRDAVADELRSSRGCEVTVADLYAMRFNPVLSREDFAALGDPDHVVYALEQRRAWAEGRVAADIRSEVGNVLAADLLVLTFPVFWFSVPAIMKGWIERVFLSGPFYGGRRIYGRGGLRGKRALVAASLGGRAHMFGSGSIHGELETGMLRHLLQGTLGYVGLDVLTPFIAHHVPYVGDEERRAMLDALRAHVRALDTLAVLPMPDLDRYDDRLAPLP